MFWCLLGIFTMGYWMGYFARYMHEKDRKGKTE